MDSISPSFPLQPDPQGKEQVAPDAVNAALRADAERDLLQLYEENFTGLFRYATALTRDRERAQDAVQEAFLRYYASRVSGALIQNGKAWLYTVLRNYIMDRFRESGNLSEVGIEQIGDLADERQNAETRLERSEISRRVLNSLSPREMDCLRLRGQGLRYREIGEVLGITPGTVGALLVRAVKKLRRAVVTDKGTK
jgi:RNA polymerase sigma-70 factor, ECF subfamily